MKNWNDFKTPELPRAKAFTMMFGFTMAVRLSRFQKGLVGLRSAFTMAEILLSLTIIGVVAAITLPSLTGNINERTWNTQRKALYARMSQAIALMPALNGYGTLKEESSAGASDAVDTAAETFITDGLAKVLKINNICDNEHLEDCGITASFTNMAGSLISMPTTLYELNSNFQSIEYSGSSYSAIDTKAAAFETANGESIITFYHQSCGTRLLTMWANTFGFPQTNMCVNFIYDLNGNKGPNTFGKDIGIMTVFNSSDPTVVSPLPASSTNAGGNTNYTWYDGMKACTKEDSESRVPNIDELAAMLINTKIVNLGAQCYWSSTAASADKAWHIHAEDYYIYALEKESNGDHIRCVRR